MKKIITGLLFMVLCLNVSFFKVYASENPGSTTVGYTTSGIGFDAGGDGSINTGDTTNKNIYIIGILGAIGVVSSLIIVKKIKEDNDNIEML